MVLVTRFLMLALVLIVSAMSLTARAQIVNIELLGTSLTAPVNDVLADINLLSADSGGMDLLGVELLGSDALFGVNLSGQDILLLGAPVAGGAGVGDLSGLTGAVDGSQGAVLEFLQDTAMGDINPTVLTLSLPGSNGQPASPDVDNTKDRKAASKPDVLAVLSGDKPGACIDRDKDSVCDSEDRCLGTPAGAIVLPSGCHFDPAKPLALQGVTFAAGTAVLTESSAATLSKVARIIKFIPLRKIELAGHTDDVGSLADNQLLSERRAQAVKRYLVAEGVPAKLLVVKGYGESQPLISIDGLEGSALSKARTHNRRVELRSLDGRTQR